MNKLQTYKEFSEEQLLTEKISLNNMINGIKDIFKSKDVKKKELYQKLENILNTHKDELLYRGVSSINYKKKTLKKKINELKEDIGEDLVLGLNLDTFIKGIYDVSIKEEDRGRKIEMYFHKYISNLPKKIDKMYNKTKPDYTGDEEWEELKKLKKQTLIKISSKDFSKKKKPLQVELLKMQEWIKETDKKLIILFEGRDAAGKGSAIKTITEYLDPKFFSVENFPKPTEEDNENWFKRYEEKLPAPGHITLYDRSWYNRAVNDPAMGYCTDEQHKEFMEEVMPFEENLIKNGYTIMKFWFSIEKETQLLRFKMRQVSPLKYWKYSSNDEDTIPNFDKFTRYKEQMFNKTSTYKMPWVVIDSNDKRIAQINAIRYILSKLPYDNKNVELTKYAPEVVKEMM